MVLQSPRERERERQRERERETGGQRERERERGERRESERGVPVTPPIGKLGQRVRILNPNHHTPLPRRRNAKNSLMEVMVHQENRRSGHLVLVYRLLVVFFLGGVLGFYDLKGYSLHCSSIFWLTKISIIGS